MRILLTSFMVPKILSRSRRTSWARPFSPMTTMLDFLPSAYHNHSCLQVPSNDGHITSQSTKFCPLLFSTECLKCTIHTIKQDASLQHVYTQCQLLQGLVLIQCQETTITRLLMKACFATHCIISQKLLVTSISTTTTCVHSNTAGLTSFC